MKIDNNKKLLSFEELVKTLEEKGIEYDRDVIEEAYYPLEDVEACLDKKTDAFPNQRPCPICGKRSEELTWIYFESPKWTWDKLMGRAGPMSICPDCRCLVEFECFILN